MHRIHNPILNGFHPDPSICRLDDDYYIANSTFEWFPGVLIHHSRDLKHWRLVGHALDRVSQLDMKGCQHSAGVWAPCLTHADGLFHLLYTNVRQHGGPVTDTPNYLVTAERIEGPWSEPVYLHSLGFDPSLFHDEDGRKYVLSMQMGEIGTARRFDGIVLQEYDPRRKELVGPLRKIWEGTSIGITEGPHLYRKDGFYYLLTAEGGTALRHAVSIARSRDLWGPYEVHPDNPILTSYQKPEAALQTAGHGDFVQTPQGEWLMVHLCNRPVTRTGRPVTPDKEDGKSCPLGRETALQKITWEDGDWPRLAGGGNTPMAEVEVNGLALHPWPAKPSRDDFDAPSLDKRFQTLREPHEPSWLLLSRRPGWLSLRGRDSLTSPFDQSLVARRLQHYRAEAETCLSFKPWHIKQAAGLIAYYDRMNYHYLRVTAAGDGRIKVGIITSDNNKVGRLEGKELPLEAGEKVHLKMTMNTHALNFHWSLDGEDWETIGQALDATMLGDWTSTLSNFTGTFWGVCCQDLLNRSIWADFDFFDYRPLE